MDKKFYSTFYDGCIYLSMLGLKLNHVNKRGPMSSVTVKYKRLLVLHKGGSKLVALCVSVLGNDITCNCILYTCISDNFSTPQVK